MAKSQVISNLSITFMAVTLFLSTIVPICTIIFMGLKKKMRWKAMLFGALLFFVFVLVLESLMHRLVLGADPTQSAVYKDPVLYMLYGGFAAGIFEEVARLLGFKFLIRVGENESIDTGISYGLGHGGIEAVLLGGLNAVGNLVLSITVNSGALDGMTKAMTGQQLESFNGMVNQLASTTPHMFLISGVERLIALVLQVSLSLFVLKAVVEKKWQYFGLAVLLHAAVDIFAVAFQRGYVTNVYLLEGVLLVAAIIMAGAAFKAYGVKTGIDMADEYGAIEESATGTGWNDKE